MTKPSDFAESIVSAIRQAFVGVEIPEPSAIVPQTPVRDRERDRIRHEFAGRHWRDLDASFVGARAESILLMTPTAWHFYLPAYLVAAIVAERESDLAAASVVVGLTPQRDDDPDSRAWVDERTRLLSPEQRTVLREWLGYLAERRPWELSADGVRRIVDGLR